MANENIFAFDSIRQLEKLKDLLGGLDECKQLGFIHVDEQGIQSLSTAGLGFLLCVVAKDVLFSSLLAAESHRRIFPFSERARLFPHWHRPRR